MQNVRAINLLIIRKLHGIIFFDRSRTTLVSFAGDGGVPLAARAFYRKIYEIIATNLRGEMSDTCVTIKRDCAIGRKLTERDFLFRRNANLRRRRRSRRSSFARNLFSFKRARRESYLEYISPANPGKKEEGERGWTGNATLRRTAR